MNWKPTRVPPPMERSLWDDGKWAFCVLLGVAIGYVLLDADNAGLLVGSLAGVVLVTVLNVMRRRTRRRRT